MSSSVNELYQQLILDHNKSPRNFRTIEHPTHSAEGYNPLCGDHFTVYVDMDGEIIKDVSFQGSGCAISKASASMMTTAVKGTSRAEAEKLFEKFHSVVTRDIHKEVEDLEELGCLGALAGVAEFPARIKCASLAWHALHSALNSSDKVVSTENP
ncbi:MAG TPA: SUF system NifU family Fe-S cluster assembly protein [Bacteroidota bacterium]|nr:SUF system NifU family Fe-S cluster assembly protein [Bacteroidota bacterium]